MSKERILGLDLLKTLACITVIIAHTCFTWDDTPQLKLVSILYYASVISVLLFFIVNGYLLFGRTANDRWYSFRKIWRILLLTFLVTCGFNVCWMFYAHTSYQNPFVDTFFTLFCQRPFMVHFWFFGALIILYIVFPFLDYLFRKHTKVFTALFCAIVLIQQSIEIINIVTAYHNDGWMFQWNMSQVKKPEVYLCYFMMGGIVKLYASKIKRFATPKIILSLLAIVVLYEFILTNFLYSVYYFDVFYDNLFVITLCALIFTALADLKKVPCQRFVTLIASVLMPVYIIHPFVADFLKTAIHFYDFLIWFILTLGLSVLIGWLLMKIAIVRKLIKI
jgi:surface polysaccharide O-acyltransferase-like enzyme